MKKIPVFILLLVLFFTQVIPSFAWDMASDFLCEVGLRFYQVARYADALSEFRKALLVNPNNETARTYVFILEQRSRPFLEGASVSGKRAPGEAGGIVKDISKLHAPPVLEKQPIPPAPKEEKGIVVSDSLRRRAVFSQAAVSAEESLRVKGERTQRAVSRAFAAAERGLTKEKKAEKFTPAPRPEKAARREKTKEASVQEALTRAERTAVSSRAAAGAFGPKEESAAPAKKEAVRGEALPEAKKRGGVFKKEPGEKKPEAAAPARGEKISEKREVVSSLLRLEEAAAFKQPVPIETGRRIVIKGKDIQRFLVTQEGVLSVERVSPAEIAVTGKKLGPTYLHVWDSGERATLSFLCIPQKPQGVAVAEEVLTQEEKAKNFKLRYHLDWSSFMTGRRLGGVEKRGKDAWDHALYLAGETPYGRLDSALAVSSVGETTDMTYLTLGLNNGAFLCLKDFSFYIFDFTPGFSNLVFSQGNLRGVLFRTPIAERKADYTVFWGREGGGKYGGLAPGLQKIKDSFLSGLNVNFYPAQGQKYHTTLYRAWGPDRISGLRNGGYDVGASYSFRPWGLGYEVAYDTQKYAYLLNSNYSGKKLSLRSELRQMDKDFKSSSGQGSRAGETGLLTTVSYNPKEAVTLSSRLDLFKDRLFAAPDDEDYWNEDFSANAGFKVASETRLSMDYGFQNFLGRISPSRNYSSGIGLSRGFEWVRRVDSYVTYRYSINRHFDAPGSDYKSHKILSGITVDVVKNIDYFLSLEQGWVNTLSGSDSARPRAYETGLTWSDRIFESSFYGNVRLSYRNEENAQSNFSFLSGEDYLEGYGEISFRPNQDFEAFFNTRVRNVWAENPDARKRIDVNLYAGLRYLWDTGLRWESYGGLEGYVFNDLNLDGVRQESEPPVSGVKVLAGKGNVQASDKNGYFRFPKVRVGKASVSLDSASIPAGYVPTSPALKTVTVERSRKQKVDFGVAVRTEIRGGVSEEAAGRVIGLKGVVLTLEDKTKATTDDYGRYAFTKVSPGRHKVTLDLKSLPTVFIPTVPIFKEVDVSEGQSIVHNFPVKRKTK